MSRSTRSIRVLATAVGVVAVAAGGATHVAHAGPSAPDVPGVIDVEAGHKPFLVGHGVGVQIYVCRAVGEAFEWGFVAPRADLFDDTGKLLTTHFGGPTWQAKDGSEVKARRDDGITVDEDAIPWLRLEVVSATAGPDGDRLEGTTWIQRTATTGGLPPDASTCDASAIGDVEEVEYTADYTFWKATGS